MDEVVKVGVPPVEGVQVLLFCVQPKILKPVTPASKLRLPRLSPTVELLPPPEIEAIEIETGVGAGDGLGVGVGVGVGLGDGVGDGLGVGVGVGVGLGDGLDAILAGSIARAATIFVTQSVPGEPPFPTFRKKAIKT